MSIYLFTLILNRVIYHIVITFNFDFEIGSTAIPPTSCSGLRLTKLIPHFRSLRLLGNADILPIMYKKSLAYKGLFSVMLFPVRNLLKELYLLCSLNAGQALPFCL